MVAAADLIVAEALRRQGWSVLTCGWPDLLAYNDSRRTVMAIELKRGTDKLRPDQAEMARVFHERIGVPFYVARDADIQAVLRKRGRVLTPGADIERLRAENQRLSRDVQYLQREVEQVGRTIEETAVVFSGLPVSGLPLYGKGATDARV